MNNLNPKKNLILINLALLIFISLLIIDNIYGNNDGKYYSFDIVFITKIIFACATFFNLKYIFSLKTPWIKNMTMSLVMTILTIFFLEWFFGKLANFNTTKAVALKIVLPVYPNENDSILGFKPKPNGDFYLKKLVDNKVLFNINFKTDSNSLRITPIETSLKRNNYAMFFGCSYTFGDGLESNQTIPFLFQDEKKNFRPYNFGYSAYSPSQMLAKLQEGKINKIVNEKNGFAFYTFIPDHVRRVIDGTSSYTFLGGRTPLFIDRHGHLVRQGLISETGFFKTAFYKAILGSNILNYFKIAYPIRRTENHFKFTAQMLTEASILYKKQFKNDNFFVVFYPTPVDKENEPIIKYLKQNGVKYLDYSKLFNPQDQQYNIPYDGHPTALANKILVSQMIKDLKLN